MFFDSFLDWGGGGGFGGDFGGAGWSPPFGGGGTYIPSYYDYAVPPFIWSFLEDDGTTFTNPDLFEEPDFQFDPTDNYETTYPKFTNMVKKLK